VALGSLGQANREDHHRSYSRSRILRVCYSHSILGFCTGRAFKCTMKSKEMLFSGVESVLRTARDHLPKWSRIQKTVATYGTVLHGKVPFKEELR
jgi:hypothetical protein